MSLTPLLPPGNQSTASKVTIIDVARCAGVGVGSVSRVINQDKGVSPEMAERVRVAIQRVGYHPALPQFRPGPRRKRSDIDAEQHRVVELVIMFRLGLGWMAEQAPIYSSILDGIETALTREGIELNVCQANNWPGAPRVTETFGRIYFGASPEQGEPPPDQFQLPSVWVMGTPPLTFTGDHILGDHMVAGQLAAQRLLDLGHTCCAYLGSTMGSPQSTVGYRGEAFRHHFQKAGGIAHMITDPGLVQLTSQSNMVDAERLQGHLTTLLNGGVTPVPTALFLQADMFAPSVYRILTDMKVRPQRDLPIITCNNEPLYLRELWPAPMVVDVRPDQISRQAVDTLLWRWQHPTLPALRILVRPSLAT